MMRFINKLLSYFLSVLLFLQGPFMTSMLWADQFDLLAYEKRSPGVYQASLRSFEGKYSFLLPEELAGSHSILTLLDEEKNHLGSINFNEETLSLNLLKNFEIQFPNRLFQDVVFEGQDSSPGEENSHAACTIYGNLLIQNSLLGGNCPLFIKGVVNTKSAWVTDIKSLDGILMIRGEKSEEVLDKAPLMPDVQSNWVDKVPNFIGIKNRLEITNSGKLIAPQGCVFMGENMPLKVEEKYRDYKGPFVPGEMGSFSSASFSNKGEIFLGQHPFLVENVRSFETHEPSQHDLISEEEANNLSRDLYTNPFNPEVWSRRTKNLPYYVKSGSITASDFIVDTAQFDPQKLSGLRSKLSNLLGLKKEELFGKVFLGGRVDFYPESQPNRVWLTGQAIEIDSRINANSFYALAPHKTGCANKVIVTSPQEFGDSFAQGLCVEGSFRSNGSFGHLKPMEILRNKGKERGLSCETPFTEAVNSVFPEKEFLWEKRVCQAIGKMGYSWYSSPESWINRVGGGFLSVGEVNLSSQKPPIVNSGEIKMLSGGQNLRFSGLGSVEIGCEKDDLKPNKIIAAFVGKAGNVKLFPKSHAHLYFHDLKNYESILFCEGNLGFCLKNFNRDFIFEGIGLCTEEMTVLDESDTSHKFILRKGKNVVYKLPASPEESKKNFPYEPGDLIAKKMGLYFHRKIHNESGRIFSSAPLNQGDFSYQGDFRNDSYVQSHGDISIWANAITGTGTIATPKGASFRGNVLDFSKLDVRSVDFAAQTQDKLILQGEGVFKQGNVYLEGPSLIISKHVQGRNATAIATHDTLLLEKPFGSESRTTLEGKQKIIQSPGAFVWGEHTNISAPVLEMKDQVSALKNITSTFSHLLGHGSGLFVSPEISFRSDSQSMGIHDITVSGDQISTSTEKLSLNNSLCQSNDMKLKNCKSASIVGSHLDTGYFSITSPKGINPDFTIKGGSLNFYSQSLPSFKTFSASGTSIKTPSLNLGCDEMSFYGSDLNIPHFSSNSSLISFNNNRFYGNYFSLYGGSVELEGNKFNHSDLRMKVASFKKANVVRNIFNNDFLSFEGKGPLALDSNEHYGLFHHISMPQENKFSDALQYADRLHGVKRVSLSLPNSDLFVSSGESLDLTHSCLDLSFNNISNNGRILSPGELNLEGNNFYSYKSLYKAEKLALLSKGFMNHTETHFESTAGNLTLQSSGGIKLNPTSSQKWMGYDYVPIYTSSSLTSKGNIRVVSDRFIEAPVLSLSAKDHVEIRGAQGVDLGGRAHSYVSEHSRKKTHGRYKKKTIHRESVSFTSADLKGDSFEISSSQGNMNLSGAKIQGKKQTHVSALGHINLNPLKGEIFNHTKKTSGYGGFINDRKSGQVLGRATSIEGPLSASSLLGNIYAEGLELNHPSFFLESEHGAVYQTHSMDLPEYSYTDRRGFFRDAAPLLSLMPTLFLPVAAPGLTGALAAAGSSWGASTMTYKLLLNEGNVGKSLKSFRSDDFKSLGVSLISAGVTYKVADALKIGDTGFTNRLLRNGIHETTRSLSSNVLLGERFDLRQSLLNVGVQSLYDEWVYNVGQKYKDQKLNFGAHKMAHFVGAGLAGCALTGSIDHKTFLTSGAAVTAAECSAELHKKLSNGENSFFDSKNVGKIAGIGSLFLTQTNPNNIYPLVNSAIENNFGVRYAEFQETGSQALKSIEDAYFQTIDDQRAKNKFDDSFTDVVREKFLGKSVNEVLDYPLSIYRYGFRDVPLNISEGMGFLLFHPTELPKSLAGLYSYFHVESYKAYCKHGFNIEYDLFEPTCFVSPDEYQKNISLYPQGKKMVEGIIDKSSKFIQAPFHEQLGRGLGFVNELIFLNSLGEIASVTGKANGFTSSVLQESSKITTPSKTLRNFGLLRNKYIYDVKQSFSNLLGPKKTGHIPHGKGLTTYIEVDKPIYLWRVGNKGSTGGYYTQSPPSSLGYAIYANALPNSNVEVLQLVKINKGAFLESSRVLKNFGKPGNSKQFKLLYQEEITPKVIEKRKLASDLFSGTSSSSQFEILPITTDIMGKLNLSAVQKKAKLLENILDGNDLKAFLNYNCIEENGVVKAIFDEGVSVKKVFNKKHKK